MDLDEAGIEAAARALYDDWPREGPWEELPEHVKNAWRGRAQGAVAVYLSRCPSPERRCGAMPHLRGGCSLPYGHEGDHVFPAWAGPSPERDTEKLSRLRSALERVESHGSGIAVTIAREALAEFTAPKADECPFGIPYDTGVDRPPKADER